MANQRKPSEIIEDFLNLIEQSHEEWKDSKSQVEHFNNNTFVWTHKLEDAPDKATRNKIATAWQNELRKRREHKDNMCLWEHIHKFACDEKNKPVLKRLKGLLTEQRKAEKYVNTPTKERELKGVDES